MSSFSLLTRTQACFCQFCQTTFWGVSMTCHLGAAVYSGKTNSVGIVRSGQSCCCESGRKTWREDTWAANTFLNLRFSALQFWGSGKTLQHDVGAVKLKFREAVCSACWNSGSSKIRVPLSDTLHEPTQPTLCSTPPRSQTTHLSLSTYHSCCSWLHN